jgi:putative transposase
MTRTNPKPAIATVQDLLLADPDSLREVVRAVMQEMLEAEMNERLNEEIRRRTYVVRIFPNAESYRRLVRALAVETHENWMEANRSLNMDDLREHKKLALRQAA